MIAYKSDVVYPDVKNGKCRLVYEELFLKKKRKEKKMKERYIQEQKLWDLWNLKKHVWVLAEMIKWLIAAAFTYI